MKLRQLALLCSFAPMLAQSPVSTTSMPTGQLRGIPSSSGLIQIVTPTGSVVFAELGAGIVLDFKPTGRPILRTNSVRQLLPITDTFAPLTMPQDRKFVLSAVPVAGHPVRVFLNGLRVSERIDYARNGAEIIFIQHYAEMDAPVVSVDFFITPMR